MGNVWYILINTDYYFKGWIPPHHCKVPDGQHFEETIPMLQGKDAPMPDQCNMYANFTLDNSTLIPCTNGWTYDAGNDITIINEVLV